MNYLCIGHVCQDIVADGYTLGGSASYCSITAHLLGQQTGMVTSFGDDFQFLSAFTSIDFHHKPAEQTTIFKNVYQGNDRTQYLFKRAATLTAADVPKKWLATPLVHLAPIADEIDFGIINAFHPTTLIAATPQGWMRQWDKTTRIVSPKNLNASLFKDIDILILSEEDIIGYEALFQTIIAQNELVILTRGVQPATVYTNGQTMDFPVYSVPVVDPTGAGDTFATGFLVKYSETKDVIKAMAYGHVVASFCIEAKGLEGLQNLEQVEERYLEYLEAI